MNSIRSIVLLLFLLINFTYAQTNEYELDDVVITAGRTPISFQNLTRSVTVLDRQEIESAPVNSVQELLQFAIGVDLKQRGVNGVQADVVIRGGTFEQTLVLIDGIKVSDPQTGHHNLNIPVNKESIQRIEVLKGQGSRVHGPNAFSGVINIITKKAKEASANVTLSGGENGYYNGVLSAAMPYGVTSNRITLSRKKSDGYRDNTDYTISDVSFNSSIQAGGGIINIFTGYIDKEFGANSFYTAAYPNQWEQTQTLFANTSAEYRIDNLTLSPKAYWRRNDDEFLLGRNDPGFFRNVHQTNIYGAEMQASVTTGFGVTSFGGEFTYDEIESTNLGNHNRNKYGFFAEQKFSPLQNLTLIVGGFAYDYADIGFKLWPGLDAAYKLSETSRLFASYGRAFRIPTFTELYYTSPSSVGNVNLEHEETTNYEFGYGYFADKLKLDVSFFRKEGENIIDWVRTAADQPWIARNIAEVNTNGIELSARYQINNEFVNGVGLSYTYLDSDWATENFQSRYVLEHLKHQVIANVTGMLPYEVKHNWLFRYEDRLNFEDYFIADLYLSKDVDPLVLFVKASNLFNSSYTDINGIPLQGRWLSGGVKLTFGK